MLIFVSDSFLFFPTFMPKHEGVSVSKRPADDGDEGSGSGDNEDEGDAEAVEGDEGGDEEDEKSPSKKLRRWFYDSSEGICNQFKYGGKRGNGNRFLTRQSCEASCRPSQDRY